MKKLLFGVFLVVAYHLPAQPVTAPAPPFINPSYVPYQFPNYSQNNSSFVNNAMQYNPPPNLNAGPYTGNGDYVDPSLYINQPYNYYSPANSNLSTPITIYNYSPSQVPSSNTGTSNQSNAVYRR